LLVTVNIELGRLGIQAEGSVWTRLILYRQPRVGLFLSWLSIARILSRRDLWRVRHLK